MPEFCTPQRQLFLQLSLSATACPERVRVSASKNNAVYLLSLTYAWPGVVFRVAAYACVEMHGSVIAGGVF